MKLEDARTERSDGPAPDDTDVHPAAAGSWGQVFSRENLVAALRRVERNGGAAGIDGMTTRELRPWLKDHWPGVRAALDAGSRDLTADERAWLSRRRLSGEREPLESAHY